MGYLVDIDSSERDPIEYPNPNDYTINLNNRIYDITSIKLVSARIPNCQPLINSGNKQFEVNGASVVFDEGTYTNGDDLASNLQIQMAPPNTVVDTVSFDSFTSKLTFSNTSIIGSGNVGYSVLGTETASNLESTGEITNDDVIYNSRDDNLIFGDNVISINFLTGESFANSMNASSLISDNDYIDGIFFTPSPHSNIEFSNLDTSTTTNVYYDSNGTHMAEMLLANIGLSTTKTSYDTITYDSAFNHFNFGNLQADPLVSNINVSFVSGNVLATDIQGVLDGANTSIDSVTFDSASLTFSNTLGGVFDDFVVPYSNIGSTLASSIQVQTVSASNLLLSSFDYSTNLLSFSNTSSTTLAFTDGTTLARDIETSGLTQKRVTFDPIGSNLTFTNNFTFNFYGGSNGYATTSSVGPPAHVLGFSGANTEVANSITSSYIDIGGPGSIFVRITSGPDDLDKRLFVDSGTFTTNEGTFDQQNMVQISPHYIGRILTSNINEIIDFNGVDDPIQHTFIKGTGKFIDDLRIRFYYNNGTKLIPYDFGKRNHILKVEIECSLDKGAEQPNAFGGTVAEQPNAFGVDSGDLPPPVEIPNLMPKNRFDNSQKTILIVSVISLLLGLALLSFMRKKRTL